MASFTWLCKHFESALEKDIVVSGPILLHSLSEGREDLDHFLWRCDFAYSIWNIFFKAFGVSIAYCLFRGTRDIIEEFLLHPPFREKGQFLWLARICAIMCNLWGKMYNRVFEGLERELEDVELLLGFTIHFGLRIRIFFFCNNSISTILLDWLSFFLEGSLYL